MILNIHYLCHALLFQCIFTGEYSHLLAPYHSQANWILAYVNKIVELNMSLVYCVVQSSFHYWQWYPFVDTGTKRASTIYYESLVFINHIFSCISQQMATASLIFWELRLYWILSGISKRIQLNLLNIQDTKRMELGVSCFRAILKDTK